jgi:hypothetical protein
MPTAMQTLPNRAGKEERNDTQCSDNNAQWDAQPLLLIGVSSRN